MMVVFVISASASDLLSVSYFGCIVLIIHNNKYFDTSLTASNILTYLSLSTDNIIIPRYGNRGPETWIIVRASTQYIKAAGSIPGQGAYKNQPMNAYCILLCIMCIFLPKFLREK